MPNIDAHVHFWKYDKKRDAWITNDMKILQRDYLPEHIALNLDRNGIDGCVAVQADQSELETLFLTELAATHPVIKGVVGWVDLQAANMEERLEYFRQFPIIKGWRHIVQSEAPGFLKRNAFLNGIGALNKYGYTYDLLIYPSQMKEALEFVSQFPDQRFVIDHCAKPVVRSKEIADWKLYINEFSAMPNVVCKISGLLTEAKWKDWSAADFYPYLDVVFQSFGTGRLLYGSDWPVILLSGIYVQWKSMIDKYLQQFVPEERDLVMGQNAIAFYNL